MIALLWLVAAVLVVGLFALAGSVVRKRMQANQAFVQVRSERHEAIIRAITDWLTSEQTLTVMLRAGVVTRDGRDLLLEHRLSSMDETEVLMTASALLRDRTVRMAIAKYMGQRHGLPHAVAMKNLMQILEWGRPAA